MVVDIIEGLLDILGSGLKGWALLVVMIVGLAVLGYFVYWEWIAY